jgi:uncharacterized membrane protein YcaP (DUF421 family)
MEVFAYFETTGANVKFGNAMNVIHWINSVFGLGMEPKELDFGHVVLRGIVVFILALVMVRLGDKRFLSKKTAFDAILGFVLASMLSRAVNGSAAFWPTIGAGFVLVALHRLLAMLSRCSHTLGFLVKGSSDLVIQDGQIIEKNLRRNDFTEHDLREDLRLNGKVASPGEVKLAYIERNGDISVVPERK